MQKNPSRFEQNPSSLLDYCGEQGPYIASKYLYKVRKRHYSGFLPCMSHHDRKIRGKNLTVVWKYKQVKEHYRIYLIRGQSAFLALETVKSVICIYLFLM